MRRRTKWKKLLPVAALLISPLVVVLGWGVIFKTDAPDILGHISVGLGIAGIWYAFIALRELWIMRTGKPFGEVKSKEINKQLN